MQWQAWLTLAVIVTSLALLLRERLAPVFILAGAAAVLVLSGVITPVRALSGFVNQGVLTVAVLFVMVAALKKTGAIGWLAAGVLGQSKTVLAAQFRLLTVAGGVSGFVNNTPVVATLTTAVVHWCQRAKLPVSKLLLPMNYATILGGLCTLIGTSTNLIVAGLVEEHPELPSLSMFDPLPVGLAVAGTGIVFLLLFSQRLLPVRRTAIEQAADTREYVLAMQVEPGGPLVGRSIDEAGLRNLKDAFLIELGRAGELTVAVDPETVLAANDRLVFVGGPAAYAELRGIEGLRLADDPTVDLFWQKRRQHLVEVVLSRLSPAVGSTLKKAEFRERYGAVVVAVSRHGTRLKQKPGEIVLHTGDTLLLEATPEFLERHADSGDFLMVGKVADGEVVDKPAALKTIAVLAAMVLANTLLGLNILLSASLAAVVLLALGCVGWREAWRAVDLQLVAVIACSFALGNATKDSGLAQAVATQMLGLAHADPLLTLVLVYVTTVLFTEVITNNAAAVLMFPIALSAAVALGVSPYPFVFAVMVGASCGFITPIGYQTNLMVYGPGGYRFSDYIRLGLPLNVCVGVVAVTMIHHVWPF